QRKSSPFTLIDAGDWPRICHLGPAADASRWNSLRACPLTIPQRRSCRSPNTWWVCFSGPQSGDIPMTDHTDAAVVTDADRGHRHRSHLLGLIPGFVYILALFIFGQLFFADPRAILFNIGGYQLAWVEVLLVAAAIMAMAEQIKVATP